MLNNLLHLFARPRPAAAGLAALVLLGAAPQAQAQWFNLGFGLRPEQVEREIAASGYQLTGPVTRNGGVYLADVLGRRGDRERLVVDATSGRLLQRFHARPAPVLADRYRYSEEPIPRPPGYVEGPLVTERPVVPGQSAPSRRPAAEQMARSEDPGFSIFNLGAPPPAVPDLTEKPKHKPAIVKRHKIDPAPTVHPAQGPVPPAVTSAPTAVEAPASAPVSPTIVVAPTPTPVVVAAPPTKPEPRVAETKSAPADAPPALKPVKARKPALNDLPVNPLE